MSFTINKKDLLELLQKAIPIIPLKSSLQILSNFRFTFNGSTLEVSATDLDHFIRVFSPVTGSDQFDIAINARKIFEIVRELPDGAATLEINENILIIKSEKGFLCKIAGTDTHDFPGFPEENIGASISISTPVLRDLILKSCFAAAKDESRAVLCGVLFELNGNKIGMVSTDGHRLGSSFYSGIDSSSESISCVMSPRSLVNLSRSFDGKGDETVSINIGEKYAVFSTGSFKMYTKLLDGPYPDYSKVIPKNNPKIALIERNLLQTAVKRVSVLSNQKTHLIKFIFGEDHLEIIVSNRDIGGEAREEIAAEYKNDSHTIGFNSQYLLEILDIIKTAKIKIEMNTQISACLIFPVHEDKEQTQQSEDLFLIMPLRILEDY